MIVRHCYIYDLRIRKLSHSSKLYHCEAVGPGIKSKQFSHTNLPSRIIHINWNSYTYLLVIKLTPNSNSYFSHNIWRRIIFPVFLSTLLLIPYLLIKPVCCAICSLHKILSSTFICSLYFFFINILEPLVFQNIRLQAVWVILICLFCQYSFWTYLAKHLPPCKKNIEGTSFMKILARMISNLRSVI